MTASFQPLRDNCIDARSFDRASFRNAGRGCEKDKCLAVAERR